MSAEELLVQLIAATCPSIGGRVYDTYPPEGRPEDLYPCVTYQLVSKPHVKTLAGNAGTYSPRYQLTVRSTLSSEVSALAQRLWSLEGHRDEVYGATRLRWLWVEDERREAEDQTKEQDERAVRSSQIDVTLWYDGGI